MGGNFAQECLGYFLISFCTASVPVGRASYGSEMGSIFLDDLLCEGTESSQLECPTRNNGLHNCDHSEDAGVQCEGILTTVKVLESIICLFCVV